MLIRNFRCRTSGYRAARCTRSKTLLSGSPETALVQARRSGPSIILLGNSDGGSIADKDPRRRHIYKGALRTAQMPLNLHDCASLDEALSVLRRREPQAVLVASTLDWSLACVRTGIPFAFDPTDSVALFYWRRLRYLSGLGPIKSINSIRLFLKHYVAERRIAKRATVVITAGPADEMFYRRMGHGINVVRIGNGTSYVDTPAVEPADDGRTIGFHGGMTWEPNRLTAVRLVRRIAPALNRGDGPKVRVRIAGRPLPASVAGTHGRFGVVVDGFVEDVRAWMASLSLYVMPMYAGAGVKNKLIEAMALGVPVLTNEMGAEALEPEGRGSVAIVKNDKDLVRAVRALLEDPSRLMTMRKLGRSHAQRYYHWATHREQLHFELVRLKAAGRL